MKKGASFEVFLNIFRPCDASEERFSNGKQGVSLGPKRFIVFDGFYVNVGGCESAEKHQICIDVWKDSVDDVKDIVAKQYLVFLQH